MTTAPTSIETRPGADRATGARTLVQMVLQATATHDGPALRFARGDGWAEMSYAELGAAVREIARGLIALGIRPGDRVSILSGTRPEWTLADLGALVRGRRRRADLPHQLARGVPLRPRPRAEPGGLLRERRAGRQGRGGPAPLPRRSSTS